MNAAAWPPTLETARARIAAVRPADYARSRNALDGAVTGLSPYLTHGFVSLPEPLARAAQHGPVVALCVYEPSVLHAPESDALHLDFINDCLAAQLLLRGED